MFLRSGGTPSPDEEDGPTQTGGSPPVRYYSGWWFVLVGAVVAIVGATILTLFAATHVAIDGHGRAQTLLLLLVPLGVALIVIGLVSVVRRKPLTSRR